MLKFRRYITRKNSSISEKKMTALVSYSNCSISRQTCRKRARAKTLEELDENVRQLRLPTFTFTSNVRDLSSDDEDDQPWTSMRQKSEDGGVTDQLEACGYEVVSDVFEVDGCSWKLIGKVTN